MAAINDAPTSHTGRGSRVPRHRIDVRQPAKAVLHSDITFDIYSDDTLLGELRISKGTIDWRPPKRQRAIKRTWESFARLMES